MATFGGNVTAPPEPFHTNYFNGQPQPSLQSSASPLTSASPQTLASQQSSVSQQTSASSQTSASPQTSGSPHSLVGLSTIQIAIIAVGSSLVLLLVLAVLVYLLCIRPRKRRRTVPPSRMSGIDEKYGDLEYTPFELPTNNHAFRQHGRTASLFKTPIPHDQMSSHQSHISSQTENETRYFLSEEGPSSPVASAEDEVTQVSLCDATSYAQPQDSHHLDSAALIRPISQDVSPNPKHLSNPISFADATQESHLNLAISLPPVSRDISPKQIPLLSPLIIPADAAPPARRPSRGKLSRKGSGYDSDDTASLYSQASASTRLHTALSRSLSFDGEFPASSEGRLIPHPSATSDSRPSHSLQISPLPVVPVPEEDAEEKQIARENTVVVAKLLKSRMKHTSGEPWRNSSIVSHIERSGSIKPVLGNEEDEPRGTRHLRKLRGRRSKMRTLSTTAMAESVSQEMEETAQ